MKAASGSMRRGLLALAACVALLGLVFLAEALRYPRGTLAQPGPGLYPLAVGALLVASSIGTALGVRFRRFTDDVAWPEGAARWRLAAIMAASLGYVLLLPYLGHALAGTCVVLVALHVMGLRGWPVKIALALAMGLGSYYVFAVLLGVPLPAGKWLGWG